MHFPFFISINYFLYKNSIVFKKSKLKNDKICQNIVNNIVYLHVLILFLFFYKTFYLISTNYRYVVNPIRVIGRAFSC